MSCWKTWWTLEELGRTRKNNVNVKCTKLQAVSTFCISWPNLRSSTPIFDETLLLVSFIVRCPIWEEHLVTRRNFFSTKATLAIHLIASCPILSHAPWTGLNGHLGWDPAKGVEYSVSNAITYDQCNGISGKTPIPSHPVPFPPWTGLRGHLGWDPA